MHGDRRAESMASEGDLLDDWPGRGHRFASPVEVDELARLVVGDILHEEWVSSVLQTCDATWDDGAHPAPDDLPMRVGGWRLDLGRAAVRSGLMASVVAGALVQQGWTQMLVGVVAAVVPSVLDIQRVALSAGDRRLLLELRLAPDVRDAALSEDELYERLPAETRAVVNRLDFAEFVARLREVGYASPGSATTVRDPDGPPIRFDWR